MLRAAAVVCHVLLASSLAASILVTTISWPRVGAAIAIVLPLLITLRGLALGLRATQQYLCVLLVPYVGVAAVEVIAHSGRAPLANIALLVAALELAFLLVLIRRRAQSAPTARE